MVVHHSVNGRVCVGERVRVFHTTKWRERTKSKRKNNGIDSNALANKPIVHCTR